MLYARGERGGAIWSQPVEIESRLGKPPQVILTPGRIHIIQEQDLRHFVSEDDGRTWREVASHLPTGARVVGLDVLSLGETLLLACLVRLPGTGDGTLELQVALWSDKAEGSFRRIASFPGSNFQQPAPRLVLDGSRIHLLCGVNTPNRRTISSGGRSVEEIEVSGRLIYLGSEDTGTTWSPSVEVVPDKTLPEPIKVLQAVELVPLHGRIHVLFSAFGLYETNSSDGHKWSVPIAVAPYRVSVSQGTYESGSVSAAVYGGSGYVAWIDARFRRSDRRWWNPLGGVPWSDDSPFWANNDVFLLPWADLEALSASHPAHPDRLTPPGQSARGLRVRAAGAGRFYLLWTERTGGKNLTTSGAQPEIVFTTVPRQ